MDTEFHFLLRDAPDVGECCPGGGLSCPDDPLELVLNFLGPADAADVSLAALGMGAACSPPRWWRRQDNGGGGPDVLGGVGEPRDSCALSTRAPQQDPEEPVDVFFADDAPHGEDAALDRFFAGAGAAPAPIAAGGVVPSGAPPRPPSPTSAAGALRPHACRAFDGCFSSDAPPPPVPADGLQLHACSAPPLQLQRPVPAGALRVYACRALDAGFADDAPPAPAPAPMPAGSFYACCSAPLPAPSPLSATPSPASRTSSGSGCLPQTTSSSETELPPPVSQQSQPSSVVVLVPRRPRSAPFTCRKRPWWLAFPLHALPPVAPPADPSGDDSSGSDDGAKNSCDGDNAGGDDGIRRRHPAARRRNRKADRVCSHCGSPETPQWRAGPEGPGTLCNACGLRYKSGKLYPEYRPSTAPGFRSDLYSNRDKKVKAIRERKERNGTLAEMGILVPKQEPMKSDDELKDVLLYM